MIIKSWSPSHSSHFPVHFGQFGDARAYCLSDSWVFSALVPPETWSQSTCWPLVPALLLGITYTVILFRCGNQPGLTDLAVSTGRLWRAACHSTQSVAGTKCFCFFSSLRVSIRSVSEVYYRMEKHWTWLTLSKVYECTTWRQVK